MKRLAYALLAALALWSTPSPAQQPITLPANTLYGRLGVGPGPGQAIPFATVSPLIGAVVGPGSSTAGAIPTWSNTLGTQLGTGILPGANNNCLVSTGAAWASVGCRERLTASRDYYIRTDGNDNCTGLVNSAGASGACAFATIIKGLSTVCLAIDTNGFNVIVHVQGMGTSATYTTTQLNMCNWQGYLGNGFNQVIFQGENGTVTIAPSGTTSPLIFATQTGAPIVWKNFTIGNSNTSGITFEADDNGFIALNTITFTGCGSGGIVMQSILNGSRILLETGTYNITGDCPTGAFLWAHDMGEIITQPGVVFALSGARTFGAMADVDSTSELQNSGSSFTGTTPTAIPYRLVAGGKIFDTSLIPGSLASTVTPFPSGIGGTGSVLPARILGGMATGVNLNSANTDTAITIVSPTANYKIGKVTVFNTGTTASLTTATAGLFQSPAGAGTAFAASQALAGITATGVNNPVNSLDLTIANGNTTTINFGTLQFRVGTAQGAAATGSVYVWIDPQP